MGQPVSDLETIREMFTRTGVLFSEKESKDGRIIITDEYARNKATDGYFGFSTEMKFRADGSLLSVGAWE